MSAAHSRLYTGAEDCTWLVETALRGYEAVPDFQSFTIAGNEDCPLEIYLYAVAQPLYTDEPVARYVLVTENHSNLSKYRRTQ